MNVIERPVALPSFIHTLSQTENDRTLLGMRLVLAGVMFPHGAQHALGWFGGFGLAGSSQFMAHATGAPLSLAILACVIELVAPVALAVGLFGRAAAAGLFAIIAVAATTHLHVGFFMNWLGNRPGEGFEFHLLVLALAGALVVKGSGALSLDRWFRAD